jgi:hypothetical protein
VANVEELAKEELVLVSTEAFMDHGTKCWPVSSRDTLFHRLEPTGRGASETHGRDTNPDRRMDMVHIKVILSASYPELWVFTIESGEIEFRKIA